MKAAPPPWSVTPWSSSMAQPMSWREGRQGQWYRTGHSVVGSRVWTWALLPPRPGPEEWCNP